LPRSLLLTGLRDLVRRPLHTGLMVVGVALGVAVVVAIDLASTSASRGFAQSTRAVVGRATHQVVGGPSGVPQGLLLRVRAEAGVRASAPVAEGYVLAIDHGRQPLHLLGVDPLSEGPFRPQVGQGPRTAAGLETLMVGDDAAWLGEQTAARLGLAMGSSLRVQVQDRVETLRVGGILHPGGSGSAGLLDGIVLVDVGTAQRLLGLGDRLSRIDLVATAEEVARVEAVLPAGARVVRASEQSRTAEQLTDAFELNLTALSLLALVVGVFLIYNTVMFSVVQRRAVLGTLRLLGTTGPQVFALVVVETAAASALGAVLGLGLGWALGQSAVRLVARTINDLYFVVSVTSAPLTLASSAKGLVLGTLAGVVAAVAPAAEAARVEPIDALRPSLVEERGRRIVPRVAGGGVLGCLAGAALLLAAGRSLPLSFAGLFAVVVGLALLAPAATVAAMALASPACGRLAGTMGRHATRRIARSVGRTGVAVAALAVAVSVTVGVSLMIASFRDTVENWLDLSLRADVYVSAPVAGGMRASPVVSADLPDRVRSAPGVADVETFRTARVGSPTGEVQLAVADSRRPRSAALYRYADGSAEDTWAAIRAGAVAVSEPFAFRHRLPRHGATVTLQTDRGPHDFPVAGVFYDYGSESGLVLISRDVYERFWDDRAISSLGVWVAPGHDPDAVVTALRSRLSGSALLVTSHRALKARALEVFDRTFAVTQALRLLAVVVAFIGVWSALLALQVERTREWATLQVLGLDPRRTWGLMLLETGLMGAVAGLLALPMGWLLAVVLVDVINVRSFGWTMQLQVDPLLFVQALGVSVLAALLASVYPTLRLRRRPLAAALRAE